MADLPQPQSYETIVGDMISNYCAKIGINDINVGSAVSSFFETVGLAVARSSGDVFQILRDYSIDRATGQALQNLAAENNITPIEATPATGAVNVIDSTFTKISTTIYYGTQPPNIGSVVINVANAAAFPNTGSVYLGRGTPNTEGPFPYVTPPVNVGSYWQITLTQPTQKFHNLGEAVVLAQKGNRPVPINSIVMAPATGANPNIQFVITQSALILDGETEVDGVAVTALLPGTQGNVTIGTINQFASPPFTGAVVSNPSSFTTGTDTENDDQLRTRVKLALASTGLGTATAIKNSLIGVTATDESATITSDSLVVNTDGSATVFISNGSAYEAKTAGVSIERIVDSAIGGERFFQLATGGSQSSVAKAFIQSVFAAPFALLGGDVLAVVVGGVTLQHVFQTSDFRSPGSVTAYEVTASINADSLINSILEATTAGNGQYVVLRAVAENHENIQLTTPSILGRDAGVIMGFPSNESQTLRLYKNNLPLSEDGNTASVFTQAQSVWASPIVGGPQTLTLSVDGTPALSYSFGDADFIATGLYPSLLGTNSLQSWAQVFNNKLTGITTTVVGSQLELTSNLGANNRANVTISSGSLVSNGMFSSSPGLSSQGAASDYSLDRNTAQFELAVPLVVGDSLAAGSQQTEGLIQSQAISGGSIVLTQAGHVWILVDAAGQIVPTGVGSGSTLTVSVAGNVVSYKSNSAQAFAGVNVNLTPGGRFDYVIVWSPELAAIGAAFEARAHSVTTTTQADDTLNLQVTAAEAAAVTPGVVTYTAGLVVLRTQSVPLKLQLSAPSYPQTYTLNAIAQLLQAETDELNFSIFDEQNVVVSTATRGLQGSVLVVAADIQGQLLNLVAGSQSKSTNSLSALYDSENFEAQLPAFVHSTAAADVYADPMNTYVPSLTSAIDFSSRDPNELVVALNPYGAILDAQGAGEDVQETSLSGAVIGLNPKPTIRRFRLNVGGNPDRFFLAYPLDFGNADAMTTVFDNNPIGETFQAPMSRIAKTNTTYATVNPYSFNAYDPAFGATTNFSASFGPTFSFANYKALMQAKKTLDPQMVPQAAILYRSVPWGRSGEKITVRYGYPTAAGLGLNKVVGIGETVDITVVLASGGARVVSLDGTTQWNVTVPFANQATYTWNGVGTNPNLSNISAGDYVNITSPAGFNAANLGVFRILAVTASGATQVFTVGNPIGAIQSGVATNLVSAISFFAPGSQTATQVAAYVNANLQQYVTATVVDDGSGGTPGSGVIAYSTAEDSGFAYNSVQLKDGINWIASSNLTGTPQFTFKRALALDSDVGYAFNNGENVALVPTTMDQVAAFMSVLAVTGMTTVGKVGTSVRGSRLELGTDVFGSAGAIQIIGGAANGYSFPALDSASRIDNSLMAIPADPVASSSALSDQWFRLQAATAQAKDILLGVNTNVTVTANTPGVGQATIQLLNRTAGQRYFGKARTNISLNGLTFRVEKQGALACFSWTSSVNSTSHLSTVVNFSSTVGDTFNVTPGVGGSSTATIVVTAGTTSFSGVGINDLITLTIPSSLSNQGVFLVIGVSDDGKTLEIDNPNAVAATGLVVASGTFAATTGVSEGDTVIVGSPFSSANMGTYRVIRRFNDSFWVENVDVMEEEVVLSASSLTFYEYDATIAGDSLVISGNVLNPPSSATSNAGSFKILSVSNTSGGHYDDTVVVQGVLASVVGVSLNGVQSAVNVLEATPYTGYKQIFYTAAEPGTTTRNLLVCTTNAQYDKVNEAAGVELTALNKLGFDTEIQEGLDSYRYNTGLIREANRVTYGDPRDPITYPGVAAAGADVFIREPLILRITLALDVRLNTGISFAYIVTQIDSVVQSLVNSNPVGQSIAISKIVDAVQSIPGITSVAVSSPQYSPTNDLIVVPPNCQSIIIDPGTDVSVSIIGG